MRHSESLKEIAPALVKARLAIPSVHKDADNPYFGNSYASLGAITAAALPVLLANGITVIQSGGQADEAGAEVLTRLQHVSGEWIETVVWLPLVGHRRKDGTVDPVSPQSAGSAFSYGRRYGLAAALSIVADEDDDAEQASEPTRQAVARTAPPKSAAAPSSIVVNAFPKCPVCSGKMWDNREGKKNPKAPDFKCKDKGCDGAIWPPKKTPANVADLPDDLMDDPPPGDDPWA